MAVHIARDNNQIPCHLLYLLGEILCAAGVEDDQVYFLFFELIPTESKLLQPPFLGLSEHFETLIDLFGVGIDINNAGILCVGNETPFVKLLSIQFYILLRLLDQLHDGFEHYVVFGLVLCHPSIFGQRAGPHQRYLEDLLFGLMPHLHLLYKLFRVGFHQL